MKPNREDFLKLLHNENPICFANNREVITLNDARSLCGNAELHYIPNSGGTKSKDISKYNAYFIDLDCGRQTDGNYYNLDAVKLYKKQKMKELSSFTPSPSAIIQTRNGLQVYWFIKDNPTYNQWKDVEEYLIETFDADKQVKSPSNQMRLPDTVWVKDKENPFYCDILKAEPLYYSYFDFSHYFIADTTPKNARKKVFNNYRDIFHHLTQEVDLFAYLKRYYGLRAIDPNSFNCIFHDDKHPSASIFRADGGIWLYSCRSSSCEFKIGNIIQVVQYLENIPRHAAIEKLCSDLNIVYEENEEYKALIMDNIRIIKDDIKNSHHDLYSVSYRYLNTLLHLHYAALDTLQYANADGFLVSVSTGHLAKQLLRNDRKTTTEDISFFALLELINKVDINSPNIPAAYKKMIKHLQGSQFRHINVYSLPVYDLKQLRRCDDIAKQVKEKNVRKSDFSYETVYNAFGEEVANRVFPQIKNKVPHGTDGFLIRNIEHLLTRDGYFTLSTLKQYYRDNFWRFKENVFVHQLPLIMERLNLEQIHSNKIIKEKYGITSNGYPKLYVKRNKDSVVKDENI